MASLTMKIRLDKVDIGQVQIITLAAHQDDSSLVNQAYDEQRENGWRGLVAECSEMLNQNRMFQIFLIQVKTCQQIKLLK